MIVCVKEKDPEEVEVGATGSEIDLWGRTIVTHTCSEKLRERINDTR